MSAPADLVGKVIDAKYRIDQLIGNGGIGAVYAATHEFLHRAVAIKVLRSDLVSDPIAMSRFVREARAAARVEHPNAVHVYDFGPLESGGAYLAMEFIGGVSLRQLLVHHGPLNLDQAFDLIVQAAAAIGAAHDQGVIHRDIKPENMMVRVGATGRAELKVVDFGIAKLLSSDTATQITRPSELIGTPKYMAPEQVAGEEIDQRIDLYALGVVLYEMLAGRAPFEGTFGEVVGKHLYAEPPALSAVGIQVPEGVERVLLHALAKDPDERIASAPEFVRELAEATGFGMDSTLTDTLVLPDLPSPTDTISRPAPLLSQSILAAAGPGPGRPQDFVTRARKVKGVSPVLQPGRDDLPTVFVPTPSGLRTRDKGDVGVDMSRSKAPAPPGAVPPARWLAPAALGLAAFLAFGGVTIRARNTAIPSPAPAPGVVLPASSSPSTPVPARGREERPPVAEANTGSETDNVLPPRNQNRTAQNSRRGAIHPSPGPGPRRTNRARAVGRALRVDRHLRKLF
jgi:serine/threonine protein kinase